MRCAAAAIAGLLLALLGTADTPAQAQQVPNPMARDGANAQQPQAQQNLGAPVPITAYGAKGDWDGTPGSGTDNTAALNAALGVAGADVYVPPGAYRFTGPVNFANGARLRCANSSSGTTFYFDDPTGTKNGFVMDGGAGGAYANIAQTSMDHCWVYRVQPGTAGALLYIANTYYNKITNNRFYGGFNNIELECFAGKQPPNQMWFTANQIFNATNAGMKSTCPDAAGNQIADIFIEGRNYFSGNAKGLEAIGVNRNFRISNNDFDGNNTVGITVTGGSTPTAGWTITANHFELNGADISLTNLSWVGIVGNDFVTGPSVTMTGVGSVTHVGNLYEFNPGAVDTHAIVLNGVGGFTSAGNHYSTTGTGQTGVIMLGPNGAAASDSVKLTGENYPFNTTPFLVFTGAANPATNVSIEMNSVNGPCHAGTNVDGATFAYSCGGEASAKKLTKNLYFDGGWKYRGNGPGAVMDWGAGTTALSIYTAANNVSGPGAAATLTTPVQVIAAGNDWLFPGRIVASGLPTSCAGMGSGVLWNDAGTVKVCP